MSIDVQCPDCRKHYRVDDEKAGLRMVCNSCDTVVSIPDFETIDDEDFDDGEPDESDFVDETEVADVKSSFMSPLQVAIGGIVLAVTTGVVLTLMHHYGRIGPENVNYVQQVYAKAEAPSENPEADKKAEEFAEEYLKLMEAFVEAIESVKDVESARAAAVKINQLSDQMEPLKEKSKALDDVSKSTERKLGRKVETRMETIGNRIVNASRRAAVASRQDKSYLDSLNRFKEVAQGRQR